MIFIKKNNNDQNEQLLNFYHIVKQMQLFDILPTIRPSEHLQDSAKTMYCFGCSKQWKTQYANTNVPQLCKIQPIINYLNEKLEEIISEAKAKGCKLKFPEENYQTCKNCYDHILNLKKFKRGSFTFDYFSNGHIDKLDKTYTIYLALWPYGGEGGFFFHKGAKRFFFVEHGDIMLFSGKTIHGTVQNTNFKENQCKVTVGLFT